MVRVSQSQQQPPASRTPDPLLEQFAHIDHPLSPGEIVDCQDIDGLIDMYEELDHVDKQIYGTKLRIREALAKMTEGDAKTRRVRGQRRKAKVTMPSDSWEQSVLKEAWNSYPDFSKEVMSIASLRVRLREFKKLVHTSGNDSFNTFRDMVSSANNGPTGTPSITIEE